MKSIFYFGEVVDGYDIPVLNEREIRAAAGILFLVLFISIIIIGVTENYLYFKYAITIFLSDMIIRVFINPKYSPTLIIGRMIVRNQNPEYVGAKQKKFAWIIGIILSTTIFTLNVAINSFSPITGMICLICLIFLFFETSFGICIGCKIYSLFYKEKVQYCPGEVCDPKSKQAIQVISKWQILIVFGFILYITSLVFLFNDFYRIKPFDLLGITTPSQKK